MILFNIATIFRYRKFGEWKLQAQAFYGCFHLHNTFRLFLQMIFWLQQDIQFCKCFYNILPIDNFFFRHIIQTCIIHTVVYNNIFLFLHKLFNCCFIILNCLDIIKSLFCVRTILVIDYFCVQSSRESRSGHSLCRAGSSYTATY